MRPKTVTANLFAELPPELRNRTYELHLNETAKAWMARKQKKKRQRFEKMYHAWHEPPLLRTSKQIRREAAPMFYKTQHFYINDGLNAIILPRYINKIRSVVQWCGPGPFKKLDMYIRVGAWEKLGEILQLLELMRTSRFEPANQEYRPRVLMRSTGPVKQASETSIFRMASNEFSALQRVFEQAMAMGRKARDEEWTKEKLEGQFALWKKKALSTRGREGKRKKK